VSMVAILTIWGAITIAVSDAVLIMCLEAILMLGFMGLAFNIGEPAFIFYVFMQQVFSVVFVIRAMTGERK
jgi:hypothetical protein